jgi:hypothetical protein
MSAFHPEVAVSMAFMLPALREGILAFFNAL